MIANQLVSSPNISISLTIFGHTRLWITLYQPMAMEAYFMKSKFKKIQNRNSYKHKVAVSNGEKTPGKREPFKYKQTQILWWLAWKLLDKVEKGKKSFPMWYAALIKDMQGDGKNGIGYTVSHSTMYRYCKTLEKMGFISIQRTMRETLIFTVTDVTGLCHFMIEKDRLLKENICTYSAVLTEHSANLTEQSAVLTALLLKSSLNTSLKPSLETDHSVDNSFRQEEGQYIEEAKCAVEKVYGCPEPGLIYEIVGRMRSTSLKSPIKNAKIYAETVAKKIDAKNYIAPMPQPSYYVKPDLIVKNIDVGNEHLRMIRKQISEGIKI